MNKRTIQVEELMALVNDITFEYEVRRNRRHPMLTEVGVKEKAEREMFHETLDRLNALIREHMAD